MPPENPVPQQTEKKIERKDQPPELSNGESTKKLPQGVVYGVVRRSDPNQQKEMVVYGWSTNQLKEEMNYIKDVRATLEKVRKRMYEAGERDPDRRAEERGAGTQRTRVSSVSVLSTEALQCERRSRKLLWSLECYL